MWQAANALAAQRGVNAPQLVDYTAAGHPIYRVQSTKEPSTDLAFVTWSDDKGCVVKPNTLKKAKTLSASCASSDAAPLPIALHNSEVRNARYKVHGWDAAASVACTVCFHHSDHP